MVLWVGKRRYGVTSFSDIFFMHRLAILLLLLAIPASAKPLVLTTIKPLTMIVTAVAGDWVEIRQLLPDGETPHHWSLKMSDRRLLDGADVVLWIGPDMEASLVDAIAVREQHAVITAVDLPDLRWPPPQPGATSSSRDAHVWLSPANAVAIARGLASWLARAYPDRQNRLQSGERAFAELMARTEGSIEKQLQAVKNEKFVVDHDGLRHFVATFGLHQIGYLRDAADAKPGAREMSRLLAETGVKCVVAEPGSSSDRTRQLARRLDAKITVIDTFAGSIAPGPDAYGRFLTGIGEHLAACLGEPSEPVAPL